MSKEFKIRWLRKALKNLDDALSFIAAENLQSASASANKIQKSIKLLKTNPQLGHVGRIHNTRELLVPGTRFLIPYRVDPGKMEIQILRVFHTSQNLPDKW